MIAFFNVLADVTVISVVALAVALGGRYERALAGVYVLAWFGGEAAQVLSQEYLPLASFTARDVAVLAGYGWFLWRYRPTWLIVAMLAHGLCLGLVLLQAVRPPPTVWVYFHCTAVLTYVQWGCLAFGVLRGRFGPPFRPPATADAGG